MIRAIYIVSLIMLGIWRTGYSASELYIAKNDSIVKINPNGTYSNWVTGVDVQAITSDASGNLYIGGGDGFVRKVSLNGIITSIANIASSGLPKPSIRGLAVSQNGTIYAGVIGGPNNISVYKIETNGVVNPYLSNLGPSLSGMAINAFEELFVTCQNQVLYKVISSNSVTNFASGFSQLISVTTDSLNNIIVHDISSYGVNKIYKITTSGTKTLVATINVDTSSLMPTAAGGVAVDDQGNIYASTWGGMGEYIDKIDANNLVTRYSSGVGGGSMALITASQSEPIVQTNNFLLVIEKSNNLTNWIPISTNNISDTNSSSFFRLKIQAQ